METRTAFGAICAFSPVVARVQLSFEAAELERLNGTQV